MQEQITATPRPSETFDSTGSDDSQLVVVEQTPEGDIPRYVNSVDATSGMPIVDRVMIRKQELETALAALPEQDVRGRRDLDLAVSTISELLTGDLEHVPQVVVASMNRWLERTKHLAETAISEPVTVSMAAEAPASVDASLDG
jgi:hypothetical protein